MSEIKNVTKKNVMKGITNMKNGMVHFKNGIVYFKNGIGFLKSGSKLSYVFLVLLSIIGITISMYIYRKIFGYFMKIKYGEQWLIKGKKNGKEKLVIIQNPNKDNSVMLERSNNEDGGVEFSYSFSTFIEDWSYKFGKWKHLFHKGNENSWPNRAPGVWLHPKKNKMRIYMNTFKKIDEYVDIDVPIKKWFNTIICVRQKILDIYIDGNMIVSHEMSDLPKQNYGDIFINNSKGFDGYLCNLKYYNRYVPYSVINWM